MANTIRRNKFELRRQSDDLVYTFVLTERPDKLPAYKRLDQDIWIVRRADWGWVAWDEDCQLCTGLPWNVLPDNNRGAYPPESDWVSRKGPKSHVYTLVYIA